MHFALIPLGLQNRLGESILSKCVTVSHCVFLVKEEDMVVSVVCGTYTDHLCFYYSPNCLYFVRMRWNFLQNKS